MTAWLKGNNKPNRQMLDYAASDDPGCERGYNPSLCRMRHTVARLKEARGMRHEYEPCAYCPKFLAPAEETTPATTPPEPQKPVEQHQATPEKPKEAEKMKKTHKCKCGEPITAVRAKSSGKCKTCYHKDYNATYKRNTEQSENAPPSAPKTGAEPKQAPKEFRDMTASEVCRAYGIQSCHNCDDESCGDNLNRIEPATNTIHASPPPENKLVIPIEESEVCRRAINQYGILRQMAKAAEEFAEAAAAINRHIATEGSHEEIISELADVEVMCVQMRLILGASAIDQQRAEKVARLHGRLKP